MDRRLAIGHRGSLLCAVDDPGDGVLVYCPAVHRLVVGCACHGGQRLQRRVALASLPLPAEEGIGVLSVRLLCRRLSVVDRGLAVGTLGAL